MIALTMFVIIGDFLPPTLFESLSNMLYDPLVLFVSNFVLTGWIIIYWTLEYELAEERQGDNIVVINQYISFKSNEIGNFGTNGQWTDIV